VTKYLPLKNMSSRLGDEYYHCLNESITHPYTKEMFQGCLEIGRRYRDALRKQLEDLGRLSDPVFVKRERHLITEYLKLVEHDLESLSHGEPVKPRNGRRRGLDQ
jgi:hypothetical protein